MLAKPDYSDNRNVYVVQFSHIVIFINAILNADCSSKKVIKNNSKLPQYYVENNHPAIISFE